MMNWTDDYVTVMESLRLNSVYMSRNHKQKYFAYKRMSNWFRVPTIVLSALASVSSVGLQAYVSQQHLGHHLSCHDDYRHSQFHRAIP